MSNIVALAWMDPIDLTIRTNFEFSFVVDCISQGAFLDLCSRRYSAGSTFLRCRGAQEVSTFMDSVKSGDEGCEEGSRRSGRALRCE